MWFPPIRCIDSIVVYIYVLCSTPDYVHFKPRNFGAIFWSTISMLALSTQKFTFPPTLKSTVCRLLLAFHKFLFCSMCIQSSVGHYRIHPRWTQYHRIIMELLDAIKLICFGIPFSFLLFPLRSLRFPLVYFSPIVRVPFLTYNNGNNKNEKWRGRQRPVEQ